MLKVMSTMLGLVHPACQRIQTKSQTGCSTASRARSQTGAALPHEKQVRSALSNTMRISMDDLRLLAALQADAALPSALLDAQNLSSSDPPMLAGDALHVQPECSSKTIDHLAHAFSCIGTSCYLVAVEALSILARNHRQALLSMLNEDGNEQERHAIRLVVKMWHENEQSRRCFDPAGARSLDALSSRKLAGSRKSRALLPKDISFDGVIAACAYFAENNDNPRINGAEAEDVAEWMVDAVSHVMAKEQPGGLECGMLELVAEWLVVYRVRLGHSAASATSASPLSCSLTAREALQLFEEAVSAGHPEFRGFPYIARQAVAAARRHVEVLEAVEQRKVNAHGAVSSEASTPSITGAMRRFRVRAQDQADAGITEMWQRHARQTGMCAQASC